MRTFYLRTDKFWSFSRILFTLVFIIAVIIVFFDSDFEPRNLIGFSIFGIYISLMIMMLMMRVSKKSIPSAVKLTTGIISLLLGFIMSYTILTNLDFNELQKIGFQIFPVWLMFLGLRDISLYQTKLNTESK